MINSCIQKRARVFPTKQMGKLSRGFTLVELAIGIAVIGLIIGTAAQLMSRLKDNSPAIQQENSKFSQEVDKAIQGFILAHSRLPCPDITSPPDGYENCVDAGGAKVDVGLLPIKTLDIFPKRDFAWMRNIAYGVSRNTAAASHDLSREVISNRYTQTVSEHNVQCDGIASGSSCEVTSSANIDNDAALQYTVIAPDLNILDFCMELDLAENVVVANNNILHTKGPADETINIAYAYALAGSSKNRVSGAGYLESLAELTTNKYMRAQLTNTVSDTNDDYRRLKSFASLYESLHCPEKLSGTEATYYNAYANVSNEYLSRIQLAAMKIQLSNASSNVDSANRDITFAAVGILLATADLLIAIAEVAEANFVAIATVVLATAELANAIAGQVLAVENRDSAVKWHDETMVPKTLAFRQRLIDSGNALARSRRIALLTQTRGGL